MKEYEFLVSLCDGWCEGTITVKAKDYETAYDKAFVSVGKKLYNAFPTLDIVYEIEPADDYEEELEDDSAYQPFIDVLNAVDKVLWDYASDNVDVVHNEETGMLDVIYHSDNNSFPIYSSVVSKNDVINIGELEEQLDLRSVGYCW